MPVQKPKDIRNRRRPLLIGWHADDEGLANENMGEEHRMEANRDADEAGDGSVRDGKDRVESSGVNATMNDSNLKDIDWDDLNLEEIDKLTSSATLNVTATSTTVHAMEGQERTGREKVEDTVSDFNDSDFDINDDVEQKVERQNMKKLKVEKQNLKKLKVHGRQVTMVMNSMASKAYIPMMRMRPDKGYHNLDQKGTWKIPNFGEWRDYAGELRKTNPGTIVNIGCDLMIFQNMWILEARDKSILTLLETIKTQLMKRMVLKRKVAEKYIERKRPEDFIYNSYIVDKFRSSYGPIIYPLRDIDYYDPTSLPLVKPPPIKAKRGRPKIVRKKGANEQGIRVEKNGTEIVGNKGCIINNYSNCGGQGHNKRTYKKRGSATSTEASSSSRAKRMKATDSIPPPPDNTVPRPGVRLQIHRHMYGEKERKRRHNCCNYSKIHWENYKIYEPAANYKKEMALLNMGLGLDLAPIMSSPRLHTSRNFCDISSELQS
ncbi:hypothetical protein CRG98_033312 [Punica granatum]|uniref:Uncharacterized protein n=1 Tax=Punica granatum TaxID=22663 RepID=A0A2I0IRF3_PUNGR|nr:hypothetical protein CRG98_033312 [Punica granatum]